MAIPGLKVVSPERIQCRLWLFDLRKEAFLSEKAECGADYFEASPAHGVISSSQTVRVMAGTRTYAGLGGGTPDNLAAAKELHVFDTATSKELGRVETSAPFWSATASPGGRRIFALAPAQHRILTIDAVTLREVQAVEVGVRPSLAIAAP